MNCENEYMLHLHQSELILEIMNQCCVWGQIKDTSSLVFQANVILIGFFSLQNVFKLILPVMLEYIFFQNGV